MEEQSNCLKIFLIAAGIYTLTWGAPVEKRNTEISKNVNETFAAARVMRNLTMCTTNTSWTLPCWLSCHGTTFTKSSIADWLQCNLQSDSFNGAVTGAVLKCFNNSDGNPQKCKLAAAAITLHDTTKDFIRTYQENKKENIRIVDGCSTTIVPDNVEQTLCDTSVRILCFLKEIYCRNSIRYDGPSDIETYCNMLSWFAVAKETLSSNVSAAFSYLHQWMDIIATNLLQLTFTNCCKYSY